MTLAQQLIDYTRAAFSGIWLQSAEPYEAQREIVQLAAAQGWRLAVWDIANGLRMPRQNGTATEAGDPLAALRALPSLASKDGPALLLLHNFHRFLANPEVMQTTCTQLILGK